MERICKSIAKKSYHLSDRDIREADIDVTTAKNPHYKTSHPMILYNKTDIINLFCAKYSINAQNQQAIDDKLRELEEIKDIKFGTAKKESHRIKENDEENNKIALINALEKYGIEYRNDSKLCHKYIENKADEWSLDQIVQRMCQMKYLYDYCNINACFEQAKKNHDIFSDSTIMDEAERLAILKSPLKKYPEKWPWL